MHLCVYNTYTHRKEVVWDFDNITARQISREDPRECLRGQLGLFATKDIRENTV